MTHFSLQAMNIVVAYHVLISPGEGGTILVHDLPLEGEVRTMRPFPRRISSSAEPEAEESGEGGVVLQRLVLSMLHEDMNPY